MLGAGEKEKGLQPPQFFTGGPLSPIPNPPLSGEEMEGKYVKYEGVKDLPVCDSVDGQLPPPDQYLAEAHRVVLIPKDTLSSEDAETYQKLFDKERESRNQPRSQWSDLIAFLKPEEVPDSAENPTDDNVLRQIQAAMNNFHLRVGEGEPVDLKPCRSDKEENSDHGGHRVWVHGGNKILEKKCNVADILPITTFPEGLSEFERMVALHTMKEAGLYYCFQEDQLNLIRNLNIEKIADAAGDKILASAFFASSEEGRAKAQAIDEALKNAVAPVSEDRIRREDDRAWMRDNAKTMQWMMGVMLLASISPFLWMELKERRLKKPILPTLPDLTAKARRGELPAVSARMLGPIKELATQLSKGSLANPCLRAENGVGKSAAVEGLAQAIVAGVFPDGTPLPEKLKGKRIVEVNPMKHFAATEGGQFRGIMEQRFAQFLREIRENGRTIPFIDETHTIVGMGKTEGSAGIEQTLKAETARSADFQFIGATTPDEYNRSIARDPALAARMPPVDIPTPDAAGAVRDLIDTRDFQQKRLGRNIPDETIRRVAELSDPATYTNQPRKAIDLLNSVAADMDIRQDPSKKITPGNVEDYVARRNASALASVVDTVQAGIRAAENGLTPEEIADIERSSIRSALNEFIAGADRLPPQQQERLLNIVQASWNNAEPQIKVTMTTAQTPDHAVPKQFTKVVIKRIATSEKLTLKSGPITSEEGAEATREESPGRKGPPEPPSGEPPSGEPPAAAGNGTAAKGRLGRFVDRLKGLVPKGAKRESIALEKVTGPLMIGGMAGSTALEHYGVITPEQKTGIDFGTMGGMLAAHPAFAAELPLMIPAASIGHQLAESGLDAVGVKKGTLGNKLGSLGGALAGMEAFAYAAGRGVAEKGTTLSQTLATGHKVIQQATIVGLRTAANAGAQAIRQTREAIPAAVGTLASAMLYAKTAGAAVAAKTGAVMAAGGASAGAVAAGAGLAVGFGIHKTGVVEKLMPGFDEASGDLATDVWDFFNIEEGEKRIPIEVRNRRNAVEHGEESEGKEEPREPVS